jgi:hypothetical protein
MVVNVKLENVSCLENARDEDVNREKVSCVYRESLRERDCQYRISLILCGVDKVFPNVN